jgi:hypothetical protein
MAAACRKTWGKSQWLGLPASQIHGGRAAVAARKRPDYEAVSAQDTALTASLQIRTNTNTA